MKSDTDSNFNATTKESLQTLKERFDQMPAGKDFLKQLSTFVPEQSLEYNYLCQIQRYARLSEGEINKMLESLGKSEHDDKRIKKKLTEAHLSHVVWLAKDFYREDIPFWDVINEGTVALVSAVGRFDPKSDSDFSEFILVSAQAGIAQFIKEETSLKDLPNALIEKINSIKPVVKKLAEKLGAEPSRAQIAHELKITEEELERLIGLAKAKEEVEGEQEQNAQEELDPVNEFAEPEYYEGSFEDEDDEE